MNKSLRWMTHIYSCFFILANEEQQVAVYVVSAI